MQKYWEIEEWMTDSLSHNLAFLDVLLAELAHHFAKENHPHSTHQHTLWMDIWGNLHQLQKLQETLSTQLHFSPEAVKVSKRDIPSLKQMIDLPEVCQMTLRESGHREKRKSCQKEREKYRGPYRSYTIDEKQHVIELHQAGQTFASISKELSIPQKNVVRWCKEGQMGKEMNRRVADVYLERSLYDWVRRNSSEGITLASIQRKALLLSSNPEFKASRGWLKNFMRRMGLTQPFIKLQLPGSE